jgi:hypothetical protein
MGLSGDGEQPYPAVDPRLWRWEERPHGGADPRNSDPSKPEPGFHPKQSKTGFVGDSGGAGDLGRARESPLGFIRGRLSAVGSPKRAQTVGEGRPRVWHPISLLGTWYSALPQMHAPQHLFKGGPEFAEVALRSDEDSIEHAAPGPRQYHQPVVFGCRLSVLPDR